jgi:hypothetical protein
MMCAMHPLLKITRLLMIFKITNISGFIGVYLAGYILELTGSWAAVFNVTAFINICGITVFALFGSGVPIV